jgi:hypothetical protein
MESPFKTPSRRDHLKNVDVITPCRMWNIINLPSKLEAPRPSKTCDHFSNHKTNIEKLDIPISERPEAIGARDTNNSIIRGPP